MSQHTQNTKMSAEYQQSGESLPLPAPHSYIPTGCSGVLVRSQHQRRTWGPRLSLSLPHLRKQIREPASQLTHTTACCKLPPVEAEYTPKGTYETINGYKTYVTGPEDSDKAILSIYDIFGYSPQILQGESRSRSGHLSYNSLISSCTSSVAPL